MNRNVFVQVVFNLAISRSFTYRIPAEISITPRAGCRVRVPFGNRELVGVITSVTQQSDRGQIKDVYDILDEVPVISDELLKLTEWVAQYYLASWGQAIQLTFPKNLASKQRREVFPKRVDENLSERQRYLFDIIVRQPGQSADFYHEKFGSGAFEYILRQLEAKDYISIRYETPDVKEYKRYEVLIHVPSEPAGDWSGLRDQQKLRSKLEPLAGQTVHEYHFCSELNISHQRAKTLLFRGIVSSSKAVKSEKQTFEYHEEKKDITLNDDQNKALNQIKRSLSLDEYQVYLLHGITGSGKTQVYIEAIRDARLRGKSAIVLIPEISLTPQTVSRFESHFPGEVIVFHSKMSYTARFSAWRTVRDGDKQIVIGPRSALFMPLNNLGIIVVDEEHDSSYKQSSGVPRYNARDTAVYRGRLNNAVVILGSATPSLESYYNAHKGKYQLVNLPRRIQEAQLPTIHIQDTRILQRGSGRSDIFTEELVSKIEQRLNRQEQVILLQNRRGYASFLQCIDCGYLSICPHCEITLTYHHSNRSLRCHYCGYAVEAIDDCPKCQGRQINYRGTGTQKIEQELYRIFPDVKLLRMDQDTTAQRGTHDRLLSIFRQRKADILLGTQMIAKGLDFENVTLVGVISAEIGLSFPDYRAAERTFQLLTQVSGRSGRGTKAGEVFIQSTFEKHYAIQYAAKQDYIGFFIRESEYRKEMSYPPFGRLINIRFSSTDMQQVIRDARLFKDGFGRMSEKRFSILGPAPAPLPKIGGMYRWQLLLKINKLSELKPTKSKLEKYLESFLKKKSKETRLTVDVDPLELL